MDNYKVKRVFEPYSDTELIDRATNVVDNMTGNLDFPDPDPPLADITTAKNNFSAAYYQVYNGNRTYMPQKRSTRSILIKLLKKEGLYVELVGNNVETVLASSGFEIYNTDYPPSPGSNIPVIQKAGDTGIVGKSLLKLGKVKHAVVYELRYTKDEVLANATWVNLICQTQTQFEITGLVPGVEYWFQARSISTKGGSGWSDPFRFRPR